MLDCRGGSQEIILWVFQLKQTLICFPDLVNYNKAAKYFKDNDAEIKWESEME